MQYRDFWSLNPRRLEAFVKAYRQRMELQAKLDNQNAWLHGQYVAYAVAACLSKKAKYPKQPFAFAGEDSQRERMERIKANMMSFAIRHNAAFAAKEVEQHGNRD